MKQSNFIFSGYNKKDELIESFIIEDRTEHEANNEAMHYVEAHQSINDWSLTPTPVKGTEPAPTPTSKEGLEDGGFTKGDWKIVPISDCCLTVQVDGFREDKKGGYIAEIKWERAAGGIGKEDEANARLIAAAPAMYEALKSVLSCMTLDSPLAVNTQKEILAILTRINKQ